MVLGITLVVTPFVILQSAVKKELLIMLAVTAMAGVMLADNLLSGLEGMILLTALVLVMTFLLRSQSKDPKLQEETGEEHPQELPALRAWLTFAAGLILLIASSRLLVWGAVFTAQNLGVSELLIGLTVVAIGTSLPELAATLASALRGHAEIAIGNVIGSNLFNLLAVMAIPGIVSSQTLAPEVIYRDYPYMVLLTVILASAIYIGGRRRKAPKGYAYLGRIVGWLLVTLYALYYCLLYLSF